VDAATLQLLAWSGAFWIAVGGFLRGATPSGAGIAGAAGRAGGAGRGPGFSSATYRCVLGLALGAVLAHLAWALLHAAAVATHPAALLNPAAGFTVLAVPLGLLATAPWRASSERRTAYLAAAFVPLPFALAVARLGCLAAGCCHGTPTELPWGISLAAAELRAAHGGLFAAGPGLHPTPLYESAGLLALGLAVRRLPRDWVAPAVLAGFGALRLAVEPWRAPPPLGPPLVPPALLAAAWLLAAALLLPSPRIPKPAPRPAPATESS